MRFTIGASICANQHMQIAPKASLLMDREQSKSEGLPWPEEYKALRPLIEQQWKVTDDIYLIRQLGGGKSGAQVYLADVTSDGFNGQAILKLQRDVDPERIEKSEAVRHQQAYAAAPDYSERHLPRMLCSAHDDERIAFLSTVAARGLEFAYPWTQVNHAQQVDVLKRLSFTLLDDWNAKAQMARGLMAPQVLLRRWLAHRLDPSQGRIHETAESLCGVPPLERSFSIDGRWLPNPLAFCLVNPEEHRGVRLRAIEGNIHGDLHGRNVLVSQTGTSKNQYFMIDLAFFEPRQFLFFDHAYFAISLLLEKRGETSDARWLSIADDLCPFDHIRAKSGVSSDDVGLTNLLRLIRQEVMGWVDRYHAHRLSYMETQFHLAEIAASLNFANKRISPVLRRRAFIYAATVLREYILLHDVDWPKHGPPIREFVPEEQAQNSTTAVSGAQYPGAAPSTLPPLPDGPSIAVMAFENLSGDDDQKYLIEGLVDEVITELSRVDWLMVISRGSSFRYETGTADPKTVGRELGVHYVLEGTVQRAGDRIRVSVKLVDAQLGGQLWAERFDRKLVDVLDLQEEIATTIASRIDSELKRSERENARKKTGDVTHWEEMQRAVWHFHRRTEEDSQIAHQMLTRLTNRGIGISGAYAALAIVEMREMMMGRVDDVGKTLQKAMKNAQRAVELNERSSLARVALGRVFSMQGKFDEALFEAEYSLELTPSFSNGYLNLGVTLLWGGQAHDTLPAIDKSIRLSPKGPMLNSKHFTKGIACYFLNDFASVEKLLLPTSYARLLNPFGRLFLAANHAAQHRTEDAQSALHAALELRPDFSVEWIRTYWRALVPEYRDKLVGDLVQAGLPERS